MCSRRKKEQDEKRHGERAVYDRRRFSGGRKDSLKNSGKPLIRRGSKVEGHDEQVDRCRRQNSLPRSLSQVALRGNTLKWGHYVFDFSSIGEPRKFPHHLRKPKKAAVDGRGKTTAGRRPVRESPFAIRRGLGRARCKHRVSFKTIKAVWGGGGKKTGGKGGLGGGGAHKNKVLKQKMKTAWMKIAQMSYKQQLIDLALIYIKSARYRERFKR